METRRNDAPNAPRPRDASHAVTNHNQPTSPAKTTNPDAPTPWYMQGDPWRLTQTALQPDRSVYFETIFAQANGYMGVRGYTEPPLANARSIREGYLAGVFSDVDEEASAIIGRFPWPILQMVSTPDLFGCNISLDGETLDLEAGQLVDFQRTLDLRDATLTARLTWRSPAGRTTRLTLERFLSAANVHLAAQRLTIVPDGWAGPCRVAFRLDGEAPSYFRCGDKRRPHLRQHHFLDHDRRAEPDLAAVAMTTRHTNHRLAFAARLDLADAPEGARAGAGSTGDAAVTQVVEWDAADGRPAGFGRFLGVATSRDDDIAGDPLDAASGIAAAAAEAGYDAALAAQRARWQALWDDADVEIVGERRDQKVVRYNVFQLLQMAPFHSDRLSLPARAYAFNRYRGLYFWDTEVFILPFYQWTFPRVARNLLAFRRRTLDGARHNAWHWGGAGALFPWMTDADTGLDNSIDARVWKLFHQTADIAWAVDQYARTTGDIEFMRAQGLELVLETARFFASRLVRHEGDAWHLERTIGPDEDHRPGLDNGFTNLMAQRNLQLALDWLQRLGDEDPAAVEDLRRRLGLADEEVRRWRDMAQHIAIPRVPDTDIPLQDEFLLSKTPADVVGWNLRADPENATLPGGGKRGDYQLIKQADIVLATWLLLDRFTPDQVAAAYDFYEPMTVHISSLSWNTHALLAARLGRRRHAYDYYLNSAGLDLDDVKHATYDGLHAAALGGCWQAVVLGFAGLHVRGGQPACDPQLPAPWKSVRFTVHHLGRRHRVEARADGSWSAAPDPEPA